MALQTINIGASANDGSGDPLRTAMDKINDNFAVLDTVFNVKDPEFAGGAVGNGIADDTAAVVAAWTAASAAANPVVYFPRGTYKVTSSSGTLLRLVEGMTVKGEGMFASIIHWIDTNSGSPLPTLVLIGGPAAGTISNATIKDLSIRGNHDDDDVEAGSYPILLSNVDNPKIHDIEVYYSRVFGIGVRHAFAPDIDRCWVHHCARDGINYADCNFSKVNNNRVEFCGDDGIAGHSQTLGVADRNHTVVGNTIRFCQGMKLLGATGLTCTGNTVEFCMGQGIGIDTSALTTQPSEGSRARFGVNISGNTVKNCFDRAEVDNENQSAPYISISCSVGRAGSLAAVPGRNDTGTGTIVDPYPYFWTATDGSTTDPIADSHHHIIANNFCGRDMYPTANLSDYELEVFYTALGSQDPDVVEAAWLENGIRFSGTGRIVNTKIGNNEFAGIAAPYAVGASVTLDGVYIDGDSIFDCTGGLEINASNTNHHNVRITNTVFDLDPYCKHSNRGANGTWQAEGSITALLIQNANGITLGGGNVFRNLCRISDKSLTSVATLTGTQLHVDGMNAIECDPAAMGFSTSNKGIGNVPNGANFILKAVDCDPASANYGKTLNGCPVAASAMPTAGKFIIGHFVRNTAPAITNRNTIIGWLRNTVTNAGGTNHTLSSDWIACHVTSTPGVVNQSTSTDNAVPRFNGTSGVFIENTAVIIDDNSHVSGIVNLTTTGSLTLASTITPPGTTGNQTINKPTGRVNIAASGTSITVTNNMVTANSIVHACAATNDTTARVTSVVASAGSFVIHTVGVTAETAFNFRVTS
jgi:hypothetical protein